MDKLVSQDGEWRPPCMLVCVCARARTASRNSPLSHEGPAGRRPPASGRRLAGLPPGTSSVPPQTRWLSPCRDYLCGSSNPGSQREGERSKGEETGAAAASASLLRTGMEISWCRRVFEHLESIHLLHLCEQQRSSSGSFRCSLNVKVCTF